jgi:hypothetical protein
MDNFFVTARRCLQPLANRGFTFWDARQSTYDRLECDRGDLQIRVSYEKFCPPWCDIHEAGRFVRRIAVESEFMTSEALAKFSLERFGVWQSLSPSERKSATVLQPTSAEVALREKHAQEIEAWCMKLLKILEDEKIAV